MQKKKRSRVFYSADGRIIPGMREYVFTLLLLAATAFLPGCGPDATDAVWLAETPAAPYLVLNSNPAGGAAAFKIIPLPAAEGATDAKTFCGQVAAAMPAGERLRLAFFDGAVMDYDPARPDALLPVTETDAAGHILTAARARDGYYGLRRDFAGRLTLCHLQDKKNADGTAREKWQPLAIPLPVDKCEPLLALSSCRGELVLAWRRGNAQQALSGWQAAVLDRETARADKTPFWRWLPSPPDNLLNQVFAVCPGDDGLVLAQDDPAGRRVSLALYVPGNEPGIAGIVNGVWRPLAVTPFPEESFTLPAYSLEISAGAHGLHLARAAGDEVRLLAAPRFPEDPGAEIPLAAGKKKNRFFSLTRMFWWALGACFLVTLFNRRQVRRLTHFPPRRAGFARAYREAARQMKMRKIGGIASLFDRALAMLVDGAVCMALPLGYAACFLSGNFEDQPLAFYGLWLLAMTVYCTATEMLWGTTPGKALLKMRVRDVDGGRPRKLQIFARNLMRIIDFFPLVIGGTNLFYLVALTTAACTVRRQRLGDLLGRTVIRYHSPLTDRKIVLGSASPQREVLLQTLGLRFRVQPADCGERLEPGLEPPEQCLAIAERKAEAVAAHTAPDELIIAADTMVVEDGGEILGKPRDDDDARRMLRLLSGKTHLVITAVAVIDNATGQRLCDCAFTEITWKELSAEEIENYLATGEHRGRAGAYGIQGEAGKFTVRLDGSLTNVIGLPLEMLTEMLEDGVDG